MRIVFDLHMHSKYARAVSKDMTPEFNVLVNMQASEISRISANSRVADGIMRVRDDRLVVEPGYDGEYGAVKIFDDSSNNGTTESQAALF